MTLSIGPAQGSARSLVRFLAALAIPLGLAAFAYMLSSTSERLRYIGPLDRAAFGWSVVIPIWVAAPVAAGFVWSRLTRRASILAALVVAIVVGAVAATIIWQALAYPDCGTGGIRTPQESLGPSLLVGAVIGGGLAGSGLVTSTMARQGRPWLALAFGAAMEVGMVFLAILIAALTALGPACQRPTA